MSARSRNPDTESFGIESSSVLASSRLQTGVLPFLTTYFGPRTACAGFEVSANNQTLRPHKGRDYTQRGGTNPAVTFDPYAASPGRATRASDCESTANNSTLKSTFPAAAAASEERSSQRALL